MATGILAQNILDLQLLNTGNQGNLSDIRNITDPIEDWITARNEWSPTGTYNIGDVIGYDGVLYEALLYSDSSDPKQPDLFIGTYWQVYGTADFAPLIHSHVESDITDLDKYSTSEVDNLLLDKEDIANKGIANGYASLDASGLVPASQLPSLDAGTLDGIDSDGFLRSNATDEFNEFSESGKILRIKNYAAQNANLVTGGLASFEVYQVDPSLGGDAFISLNLEGQYATYFGLDSLTNDLFVGGWSKGANKYKIWHEGNDGPGSGLDADTLDGFNSDDFLSVSEYTASDILTKLLTVDGPGSGLDADLLDGNNSDYFLPASSYSASDILSKLITVDGDGSGLDADTLDGYHAADLIGSGGGGGATGGGDDEVFYENDIIVTTNYTITVGKNAMTAGPIEINDGVTITVPSGSVWTIV